MPLGRRADLGDAKYAGVEVPFAHDMEDAMQIYLNCGFDFVVAPLAGGPGTLPASPRDDLMLTPASAGGQIVGSVSAWVDPDSDDPREAARACETMAQELAWAAFLGLQAVVVPPPPRSRGAAAAGDGRLSNYAQVISQALSGLSHMAVWVRLPLTDPGRRDGPVQLARWRRGPPPEEVKEEEGGARAAGDGSADSESASSGSDEDGSGGGGSDVEMAAEPGGGGGGGTTERKQQKQQRARGGGRGGRPRATDGADSWAAWNQVYTMCERSPLLGVMLDLSSWGGSAGDQSADADAAAADAAAANAAMKRWLGEPLRAVAVSTAADFAPNRRGFPVMRRALQPLVELAFQHNVQLVLTGPGNVAGGGGGGRAAPTAATAAAAAAAAGADPTPAEAAAAAVLQQQEHPLRPYWDFCSYLFRRASNGETVMAGGSGGADGGGGAAADGAGGDHAAAAELIAYRDYLQAPLQPLQDNLESQTYETFERDSVKYERYRAAVEAALVDLVPHGGGRGGRRRRGGGGGGGDGSTAAADSAADAAAATLPPPRWSAADDPDAPLESGMPTTVLMVVGAGRGPLVRASIAAAEAVGRPLRVYALEKNPAALVHLQAMVARHDGWRRVVTIVAADMRDWDPPEPADVLVSELLGSFGDNELSPECLDGAQRRLLRPGGISIPSSYTSFLAPCASSKLWEACKAYKDLEHLETPYVVRPHRHTLLSPPQRVFRFAHPNPAAGFYGGVGGGQVAGGAAASAGGGGGVAPQQQQQKQLDNTRRAALAFSRSRAQGPAVCHGLIGYFSSVLYKHVALSTHPDDHTPNMASWFPIFFPFRDPLALAAGERLDVAVWRCQGRGRVWYEWAATAPRATPIHNPAGRSYWVGL